MNYDIHIKIDIIVLNMNFFLIKSLNISILNLISTNLALF